MVKTEVKPNKVEGSLYADDALAEYETEFKDADITLETSTIPVSYTHLTLPTILLV